MRSSRFSLMLAAALAFVGGLATRVGLHSQDGNVRTGDGNAGMPGTAAGSSSAAGTRGNPGDLSCAANSGKEPPGSAEPTGVMRDALVRKAVEGADLAAGVREIMAHQEEDHCADTRLVCLVENLPAERLAELPGLLDQFQGNDYVMKFVLGPWAKRDPAAALAWVEAHPSLNASGMNAFLTGWTRSDPTAALAWVDGQGASARGAQLRSALVEGMSETDPAGALALMQSKGWISKSPDALLKLLQNWGVRDPAGALEGLRSVSGGLGLSLENGNGNMEPPDEVNGSFTSLMRAMLYGAFQRSPQEAMALVSQLTPAELAAGNAAVAKEVLARDPALAESLFAGSQDASARQLLLGLAQTGSSSIFTNIGRITDPAFRQELLLKAASGWASSGDDAGPVSASAVPALRSAVAEITDAGDKAKVSSELCQLVMASDSGFATELWSGLSEEQQLNGTVMPFFSTLGQVDVKAALAAYEASTPQVRAVALKILSRVLAQGDPQAGLELVLQEEDPVRRAASGATLLAFWSQKDPAKAIAALEAHAGDFDLNQLQKGMSEASIMRSPGLTRIYRLTIPPELRQKLAELTSTGGTPP